MERPALKRLMDDIEAGHVDCVIVYKVDRLSRSLLDFTRIMETFDRNGVSFVSVTQQFNTTSSMGRLTLNILLSFAQFEREMISERTRDKMGAARRKGKYIGSSPVLGYDADREAGKLVVNETEAEQVREIFELYLKQGAVKAVLKELDQRGWTTKRITTKAGKLIGGQSFTKSTLHLLLKNVTYIGRTKYKGEIYEGEHEGIVDPEVFEQVQRRLNSNQISRSRKRQSSQAILQGLVHCQKCGKAMMPHYSQKQRQKRYRYYVCSTAHARGKAHCDTQAIPADQLESYVIEQLSQITEDPQLRDEVLSQVSRQRYRRNEQQKQDHKRLTTDRNRLQRDLASVATSPALSHDQQSELLAQRQDQLASLTCKLEHLEAELSLPVMTDEQVLILMEDFAGTWDVLTTREQKQLMQLLVSEIFYDAGEGEITIQLQ